MKVSLNWLKELVDLSNISNEEIENAITFKIIEIESFKKLVDATNLAVGHVLECEMHPDSDHLHVCSVDLGTEVTQIVCGAPNVAKGQHVIVAKIGAVLPGDFKIKKSKIRGVESNGMICSLQELGFDEKYIEEEFKHGIYVLGNDAKPGDDPLKYLYLDDYQIDLELTPNRGDLLSHLGVAYDLAAVFKKSVKYEKPVIHEIEECNPVKVTVESDKCLAYNARYVKDVKIMQSPWWLKARLISSGVRPINNVVDITNYVMLELGQPLHSFDAKKLGNNILVRNASQNEEVNTLDEEKRVLNGDDIVITDGSRIVAIAGVMGGLETAINEDTTDIILESAYFDALAVRKTSGKLGLRSESSMRFERRIDPNRVKLALDRACELYETLAGGKTLKNMVSVDNLNKDYKEISITVKKINSYIGTNLSEQQIKDIFVDLGFVVENKDDALLVTVPTRRVDIENYQDLIEEVARIYGYNNVPSVLPTSYVAGKLSNRQNLIRNTRFILAGLGLKEVVTYTLVNKADAKKYNELSGNTVDLLMPITEEHETLRESQINGIIDVLNYNASRKLTDISIFEIGRVYSDAEEKTLVSGALTGHHSICEWQGKKETVDFYLVKGILDVLFTKLDAHVTYEADYNCKEVYHKGKYASILLNGEKIGFIGALNPKLQKELGLDDTFVFEIDLKRITKEAEEVKRYVAIPKTPAVKRDIAILVDKSIPSQEIIKLIVQTGKKTLIDAYVFDVYEDEKLNGKKSIAISLTFQDLEKTLESADVDKRVKSIVDRLAIELKAELRQ